MRLRKIKMAGFKSFVDPTTLVFPSDMVGIVGPNGCGKSNIVDAIRWVMGASSKNIRGDTLEDVIFKGSSGRKPVGQASIELIFDNSEGKAGGQYASYNEIAIRRTVARDGQSKYYLNGTQCRRRDISDLFLGTGLGPRSYAIIEQGTISRLIDAKPEEMRVHLEEAAGISKYKERRRETENRIRHTRENLDRLNDLIDEVDKQITRLKRQAAAAERYKKLKQEERRTNAELLLLRLDAMGNELGDQHKRVESQETKVEQTIASLRTVETALEQLREDHTAANDSMNEVQGQYYQIGADISRLEQSIQHATETKQRHETERDETLSSLQSLQEELDKQGVAQTEFDRKIEEMTRELQTVSNQASEIGEEVSTAESAELKWREAWEELITESNEPSHQVEVYGQKIEFLEEEISRLEQRRERYRAEHDELLADQHKSDLGPVEASLEEHKQRLNQSKSALDQLNSDIQASREYIEDCTVQLDKDKTRQQELLSSLTTLNALQEAALKGEEQQLQDWITAHSFEQSPRLADQIEVEAGWEQAVETVLGGYLEAICTDDIAGVTKKLDGLESGHIMFFDSRETAAKQFSQDRLASKVSTDLPVYPELENILVADSLSVALKMRPQLEDGQSVITPDGYWMSQKWVRFSGTDNASESVLLRKAEISELQKKADQTGQQVNAVSQKLSQATARLSELEVQREQAQQQHNSIFQEHAEIQTELARHRSAIEHWQHRDQQLRTFIEEASNQLEDYLQQKQAAKRNLEHAQSNLEVLQGRKDKLLNRKEEVVSDFQDKREQAGELQERRHSIQLEIETLRTRAATSKSIFTRLEMQLSDHNNRIDNLNRLIEESNAPINDLSDTLKDALDKRLQVEAQLTGARKNLENVETRIRENEEKRIAFDNQIDQEREDLNKLKMRWQELKVRAQTVKEQLEEFDWSIEELNNELDEDATLEKWEKLVAEIELKINRLGSINLAAIDEFQEQSERKEYLDSQHADLTKALETLETAIRKIDKETKDRFKDTFDQVNAHIQNMYPRLFPGGKAYLEMTGDDLLNTGVTIMARPPGKRVSSIQLLSGGEKALTAAALVLAIFELNPAPFCLLDEVDAPLDDANVGRFCDLIKHMSERVQFVFITHNKSTMGYAEHLLGVTMNEPGVSRLVSVDIEEAAEMASA